MRLSELLTEGATGILYHTTSIENATKIVGEHFILSNANETSARHHRKQYYTIIKKRYPYYLSTSRSKVNYFKKIMVNGRRNDGMVTFVMDGNWLNRKGFITKPIDFIYQYYKNEKMMGGSYTSKTAKTPESEDRVWSKIKNIPATPELIREVHILFDENKVDEDQNFIDITKKCNKFGIPWWAYIYENEFIVMNKKMADIGSRK